MNRMIVSVFDREDQAFEGLSALKALNKDGDISLYATAVISKSDTGEVEMKSVSDKGPIGMPVGMLGGAFVGMLGGPVGMAFGAMMGSMGGMLYDMDKYGLDSGFVDEVAKSLQEGKVAVIADVDEGWTAPIDTRMEALNAMVFRLNRSELVDEQLNREAEALNAELDELEEELKEANDDMKESIQKQIDLAKKKGHAMQDVISKKMEEAKAEADAKTAEINNQLKDAGSRKRKKLEKRRADLKSSYEKTRENLSSAADKVSSYMNIGDLA